MKYLKTLFLFFVLGSFSASAFAQALTSLDAKLIAFDHIKQLKESVLIVQIPSNTRKIALLETLAKNNPSNKRYAKMLAETLKGQILISRAIVLGYQSEFDFSAVYFIADTLSPRLWKGERSGIFLNSDLVLDQNITLPDSTNFYLAFIGKANLATSTGQTALLIQKENQQLVAAPFPYSTKLFAPISPPTALPIAYITKAIENQNAALHRFHHQALAKEAKLRLKKEMKKQRNEH